MKVDPFTPVVCIHDVYCYIPGLRDKHCFLSSLYLLRLPPFPPILACPVYFPSQQLLLNWACSLPLYIMFVFHDAEITAVALLPPLHFAFDN
jgi:hypothetical protein